MSRRSIPNRWEEYSAIGKVIAGTNFIAFKVPLKDEICRSISHRELRFTPAILIEKLQELGFVIDLTNTQRYYNPQELIQHRIMYEKIFCEGRRVPSREVTNKFFSIVDKFCQIKSERGRIIGVHCTHGLNRTGYLVCRYMIDRMGFSAEEAIKEFEKARGHKMERAEYIDALYNKNSSDERADMKAPRPPANVWMPHQSRKGYGVSSFQNITRGESTWQSVQQGENSRRYNSPEENSRHNSSRREIPRHSEHRRLANSQRDGFSRWNNDPLQYSRSDTALACPNYWTTESFESRKRNPSSRDWEPLHANDSKHEWNPSRHGNRWNGQQRSDRNDGSRSTEYTSPNRYYDRPGSASWPLTRINSEERTVSRRHQHQSRVMEKY